MQNNKPNRPNNRPKPNNSGPVRSTSRGAAIRAQKRSAEDANRIASQYLGAQDVRPGDQPRANFIDTKPGLKIMGLGGMDSGGSKNMILLEYMNDAVVIDCGN